MAARSSNAPAFPALAVASALVVPAVSAFAEPLPGWNEPLHGVAVLIPAGWSKEIEGDDGEVAAFTCDTPECKVSQRACTVIVPDAPITDMPSFVPDAWMVAVTSGRVDMRGQVLEDAQEGTEVSKEPGTIWLDGQSWYTTETLAPYGWKSKLNAVGILAGRYVRVDCRTCERGGDRFAFAHAFLKGIEVPR